MSKIIYLAAPYSHEDKHIRELRYLQITEVTARLIKEGNIVFSPITYGHILSEMEDLPTTFEFWEKFCLAFLEKCDEMYVLTLDGYSTSKGVSMELKYCDENKIPVKYIDYVQKG